MILVTDLTADPIVSDSPIKGKEINEGLYTKREISPTFTLFWRILRDLQEIEIAIRAKGTGFVGIGWRPNSLTKHCQRFPKLGDEPEIENEEAESAASEPETEPETEPEPEKISEANEAEKTDPIEKESSEQGGSVRQARTVRKSIDVSIGFVTSSVTSGELHFNATFSTQVIMHSFFFFSPP